MPRPERLRRVWRLPPGERWLAAEAAAALAVACLAVRWLPARALGLLLRRAPAIRRPAAGTIEPGDVMRMIERVAPAHPWRPLCLEQALAGRWMLARRGRPSTLVLGARRPGFEAHAWLEVDRLAMQDSAHVDRYQPIWRSQP